MTLVVHPHFHSRYTGATRHVETIVPAMASSGAGVEARVIGSGLPDGLPRIGWTELLRRARAEELVWHAHRFNELAVGWGLRLWGKKVRLVYTRHGLGRPSAMTRLLTRRADAVVSLTPDVARDVEVPSTVVGHGVDLVRFAPPEDRAASWRRLEQGGRHGIGVIGRVRPDKGQGDFAAALHPLATRHPEWTAVLVGLVKPAERDWAASLWPETGPRLHQVGEQRDVEAWYRGLTIVVNPSHEESFGLARAEALAAGCCLVATRLNALDGMIEHGQTGFLYDAGDVAALRELLEPLLREPERAARIGRNAAELARARLGIDREVSALLALYRSL